MFSWNIYTWISKLDLTVVSLWRTTWRKLKFNLFFQQRSFYLGVWCMCVFVCLTLIPEHGDDDCCSWQPSGSTKLQRHSHPTGQRLGTGKSAIFLSFLTVNSWVVQPLTVPFTACNKTVETVLHNKIHINFPLLSIPSIPNLKCIIQPRIILV